jgi:hypothetical protein
VDTRIPPWELSVSVRSWGKEHKESTHPRTELVVKAYYHNVGHLWSSPTCACLLFLHLSKKPDSSSEKCKKKRFSFLQNFAFDVAGKMSTNFLDYVDYTKPSFLHALFCIVIAPIIWNTIARLEFYTHFLTKITRSPYIGCYVLALWIFCFSLYRDFVYELTPPCSNPIFR